ncbi:MAG: GGDEF domain-containing protein [Candidatus Fimadaptatus sp.]
MNAREILKLNMQRSWRGYEAFLKLIAALEGMMMIYGALKFDFGEARRRLYFACYVLLFVCTVIAFIINRVCIKTGKHDGLLAFNVYFYTGVLILWSAIISALDLCGGGYPVTYMTIMAGVGSMVALPPVLYGCIGLMSSASMIIITMHVGGATLGLPFYLNHCIFLLVIIAVELRNFRSLRKQYMMDRRLEELAEVDSLTQIANRHSLDKYMAQLIGDGAGFTFALLDADNFKTINDTFGHLEGDSSLVRIADILTETFERNVFRYGGDEFAVVSFEDAQRVADRLARVNLRLREEKGEYELQVCAGVYQRQKADDERRVFELADRALYRAKQGGKARAVIYEDEDLEQAVNQ